MTLLDEAKMLQGEAGPRDVFTSSIVKRLVEALLKSARENDELREQVAGLVAERNQARERGYRLQRQRDRNARRTKPGGVR